MHNKIINFFVLLALFGCSASTELSTLKDENIKLKKKNYQLKQKTQECECPLVRSDTTRILYEHEHFGLDTSLVHIIKSFKHTRKGVSPSCIYQVGQHVVDILPNGMNIFKNHAYVEDQFLRNWHGVQKH